MESDLLPDVMSKNFWQTNKGRIDLRTLYLYPRITKSLMFTYLRRAELMAERGWYKFLRLKWYVVYPK